MKDLNSRNSAKTEYKERYRYLKALRTAYIILCILLFACITLSGCTAIDGVNYLSDQT